MVDDIQISRAAYRFNLPVEEFVEKYKSGLRWCQECKSWVGGGEVITDSNYTFGHKWLCLKCANKQAMICPECGGDTNVINHLKRGLDTKLTRQCVDCDHEFHTAVNRNSGKEKMIKSDSKERRREMRRDLGVEAELCFELGKPRFDPEYQEIFREWIFG